MPWQSIVRHALTPLTVGLVIAGGYVMARASDTGWQGAASLRDIRLLQISASKDGEIQDALIRDSACLRAVTNRLRLGHYICQVES
jgi:hypothetical protein